jgi:hypothetical protein
MAGRPKSNASSESASPTSGDTSSSEYELTIYYEENQNPYAEESFITIRGVLKYGEIVLMDRRENNINPEYAKDNLREWAQRYKFANEVKLGNVEPEVIKLEED